MLSQQVHPAATIVDAPEHDPAAVLCDELASRYESALDALLKVCKGTEGDAPDR